MKKANPLQSPTFIRWLRSNLHDDVVTRMQAWVDERGMTTEQAFKSAEFVQEVLRVGKEMKEKPEEACARLGITDEKTRAFVFEHERKHAEMSEALHMQHITKKEQASDSSDM